MARPLTLAEIEANTYLLGVSEIGGPDLDFEVQGREAALFCANAEFASPNVTRVIVMAPGGSVIEELVK